MSTRPRPIIAIDGPSGVGKSTLASRLAEALRFTKLDTGAMYRAFALKAIERDADIDSASELDTLLFGTRIVLRDNRVLLDTQDVTDRIRDNDVSQAASRVSVHPRVRVWLVSLQQTMGAQGGIVMEGRDIGTAVFPDAEIKFFLDANEDVRSERRYLQQASQEQRPLAGLSDEERERKVRQQLRERDARDRTRAASPLVPAPDAVTIDTTRMTLDEVIAECLRIVRDRFPTL